MTQQSSSRRGQGNTRPEASQAGQNTSTGTVREVADQAKETAGQVVDQAKETAGQVVDQAREQVSSRLAGQKDRAAEGLNSVAHALRQTGQQLREQDQPGVTDYIDRAASQVERFSSYIQQNDLGQLVDDVERFARRQPGLFLGGAFVLGLLGARFLKSSRPYTGSTALAERQQHYYGTGTASGLYPTAGRPTTWQSPTSQTGPRRYDPQREG